MQIHATPFAAAGWMFRITKREVLVSNSISIDAAALVATASLRSSATRSAIIAAPSSVHDRAVMLDDLCRELTQGNAQNKQMLSALPPKATAGGSPLHISLRHWALSAAR